MESRSARLMSRAKEHNKTDDPGKGSNPDSSIPAESSTKTI